MHATLKALIDALDRGDKTAWSSHFEGNAQLFDDGSPRELRTFTNEAIGHERFTDIGKISVDGSEVIGKFHSDQWGDFTTYFRVKLPAAGKITRLDD